MWRRVVVPSAGVRARRLATGAVLSVLLAIGGGASAASASEQVVGSDGNLWSIAKDESGLVRTTSSGAASTFPAPAGRVLSVEPSRSGGLWYVAASATPGHLVLASLTIAGAPGPRTIDLGDALGDSQHGGGRHLAEATDGSVWLSRPYDACDAASGGLLRVLPSDALVPAPGDPQRLILSGEVSADGFGRIWAPTSKLAGTPDTSGGSCGAGFNAVAAWHTADGAVQTTTADGRAPACSLDGGTVASDGAYWCAGNSAFYRVSSGVTQTYPFPQNMLVARVVAGPGEGVVATVRDLADVNGTGGYRTMAVARSGAVTTYPDLTDAGTQRSAGPGSSSSPRTLSVSPTGAYWFQGIGSERGAITQGQLPAGVPAGTIVPTPPTDVLGAPVPVPPRAFAVFVNRAKVAHRRSLRRQGRLQARVSATRDATVFVRATIRARDARRLRLRPASDRRKADFRIGTVRRTAKAGVGRPVTVTVPRRYRRRLTHSVRPLIVSMRARASAPGLRDVEDETPLRIAR